MKGAAKWVLTILLGVFLFFNLTANAAETLKFAFNNEEVTKIIETYAKASGEKFVVDAGVRGKASIFNSEPVTLKEAFNLLSSALATNGYAIAKRDDEFLVMSARNVQRNLTEVTKTLPSLRPERMVTYILSPKNTSVSAVNRDLRILPSRDGELSVFPSTNSIIITDWTSNLHRIHNILMELDKPTDPKVQKFANEARDMYKSSGAKVREKTAGSGKVTE
ncbi:MAG: hypothetical protein AB7O96_17345 [Pseudobdellovibrionaceae bacterium]